MEKQNESIRERLLAHLPQPENLAAYREETALLLAKREKALFWERLVPIACYVIVAFMMVLWLLGLTPAPAMRQYFWPLVAFVYFLAAMQDLRYRFYQSKVDTLKEVKQVQLQILELQASLQKPSSV